MSTPSSLRVVTELDRVTVHLPRRVDAGRLFFTTAGLATLVMGGVAVILSEPILWVVALICGALLGLLSEPLARLIPIRTARKRRASSGDGCGMAGGVLFVVIICHQLSVKIAEGSAAIFTGVPHDVLGGTEWVFFAAILLALAATLPMGLGICLKQGRIILTPATLSVNQQRWLLEEIEGMTTRQDGTVRINGAAVGALSGLTQRERTWLRERILQHVTARRALLAGQGHDLSRAAAPPAALQRLRGED